MTKTRLEAFSDSVLAIVITIMVLELRVPEGAGASELVREVPALLSYVLSFIYVGIYWSNHHHMMQSVQTVDGRILWANLHLLFWLSLIPFTTAWLRAKYVTTAPVAVYGIVLLMSALAYYILAHALIRHEGNKSAIHQAVGRDMKGKVSLLLYAIGVAVAFAEPALSLAIFVAVAALWFVPDRRMERVLL